jgi:uncharacterized protein
MSPARAPLWVAVVSLIAASGAVITTAADRDVSKPAAGEAYALPAGAARVRLEKNLMIPMRDGVSLAADLYFPEGSAGKLPVILIRTPYGKQGWRRGTLKGSIAGMFASHGYVVAVEDKRGRFLSQGRYTLAVKEDVDGYDTIEWLAKQNWSSGKVGTYGCSDLGDAQVWLAPTRPPALAAMVPQASGSSVGPAGNRYRYFGAFNGGALQLAAGADWMLHDGSKVFWGPPAWLSPELFRELADDFTAKPTPPIGDAQLEQLLWTLPVIALMQRAEMPFTDWETILRHPLTDPWWNQFPYLKGTEQIDAPALFINSWGDFGVNETLFEFNYFRTHSTSPLSASNQFVIISPTTHCVSELMTAPTVVGARELGDARKDFWSIYLKWYAHWLKGEENGITSMPRVQYYEMGKNQWRSAESWPILGTKFRRYYLHSGGSANTRYGDGALSLESPRASEPADSYTDDPASPVPTGTGAGLPDGYFDQRATEMRSDVLVYSTPLLTTGVEVTGPITVRLYVSSSAPDTDFTAKLVDVYPDGRAYNVQDGILRARYREGFGKQLRMSPGQVYPLDVSLDATSNFFDVGHRIRLEVSSSNFPRFDRNLNTGGDNFAEATYAVARNSIHHSRGSASYLTLPVVPAH